MKKIKHATFSSFLIILAILSLDLRAAKPVTSDEMSIVTLSPHLSELVYALGKGSSIVAVSDHSDYPSKLKQLPSVASYQGANIAEILRLQPSHVLVWRGGNKDADIAKLYAQNVNILESKILSVDDLFTNILEIGKFLGTESNARRLVTLYQVKIAHLKKKYQTYSKTTLYYLNTQPFIGLGKDAWLNSLLNKCGLDNIYKHHLSAYPQLNMTDILRQQPEIIIAANNQSQKDAANFWKAHRAVLKSKIIKAKPDALHRFTTRSIDELLRVCELAHQS